MRLLATSMLAVAALTAAGLITTPGLAGACAGLIGSNGAVNLGRTTTLAGYHDGEEHYVTAFEFHGGGGEFGTLIPLPAVPSKVERGGDWTLQRLQLETRGLEEFGEFDALPLAATGSVDVLQEVRIDALDLTVLKGGGPDVAVWAEEHGFRLSPDAPEVLDFYARRSPIFLAAVFDGEAAEARGQALGDGTPVHITMPTDNPWVPLRILGLGKQSEDFIQADVFLLTDERPALLPAPNDGLFLTHDQKANDLLLDDLRSDAGMGWVPDAAWLTKLEVNSSASALQYDLAIDTTDAKSPSRIAAGLELPDAPDLSTFLAPEDDNSTAWIGWVAVGGLVAVVMAIAVAGRRTAHNPSRRD
jgi:hypothetical protein